MDQDNSMANAVREVTSVAEELRAIKKRADEYGQASARLQEIASAIDRLKGAIVGMQDQFQQLLAKAESVAGAIEQARQSGDAMAQSVPAIVERIEASDVSKHVARFADSLNEAYGRIEIQASSIEQMRSALAAERDQQRTMFDVIGTRLEQLANDVSQVRGLSEPIAATYSASDKAANASTMYGHKGLQAISTLTKRMDALQSRLDEQSQLLTAIKNKKGIMF